jgi:RHS repeat-associated protein
MHLGALYPFDEHGFLGSIYATADAAGTLVRNNSYDVYGDRLSSTGAGPQIVFGYTGREHSPDDRQIYHRDRYRDPGTSAWFQPDRRRLPAGPNEYLYGSAHPTASVDPFGQEITTTSLVLAALFAAALAGAGTFIVDWFAGTPMPLLWAHVAVNFVAAFFFTLPWPNLVTTLIATTAAQIFISVVAQALTRAMCPRLPVNPIPPGRFSVDVSILIWAMLEGFLALLTASAVGIIFGLPTTAAETVGLGIAYAVLFSFFDLFVSTDFTLHSSEQR